MSHLRGGLIVPPFEVSVKPGPAQVDSRAMARPLRLEFPGAVYHVISRGNARHNIVDDDRDRSQWLTLLAHVVDRYGWFCHAYCLMDETPQPNLSLGMRQLNGWYTQAYNRRHHRVGHLYQGRFTAILVEKETHLLELCRYVVLNPVRAKLVPHPRQWTWSSYRATVGETVAPRWLTTDWRIGRPYACCFSGKGSRRCSSTLPIGSMNIGWRRLPIISACMRPPSAEA